MRTPRRVCVFDKRETNQAFSCDTAPATRQWTAAGRAAQAATRAEGSTDRTTPADSALVHFNCQKPAIYFSCHLGRCFGGSVFDLMDRGQNVGAGLKHKVLAPNCFQTTVIVLKSAFLLRSSKSAHRPLFLLLNKNIPTWMEEIFQIHIKQ